ncbi:GFA family protein [Maricaulis sp. D1M11]|uniref:GFA family protein n=1 Tax=Maricaulis sp. D1M11 TaxID=3076117 RepID=UPI0039B3F85D
MVAQASAKSWRHGECHCGEVGFAANLPDHVVALSCNCSICAKTGFIHLIVEKDDFKIERGAESLSTYTFGSKTAKHLFCKTCGVKAFYVPRSHPDSWSVNLRCLDADANLQLRFEEFDGANWEDNIQKINPEMARTAQGED